MVRDVVFIVGAPRSGTTWLQQMLGAHPSIATPQETDLFDGYLSPLRWTWTRQLPASDEEWRRRRFKGLPAVITEAQLDEIIRTVAVGVYAEVLRLKPSATVVLEKVPGYAHHACEILRTFPNAKFIHLLRDGRDAAASMLRASRGWGAGWAPSTASAAAAQWRDHVRDALGIADLTTNYTLVRFEDLRSKRGPDLLADLLTFGGVSASGADEIYRRFALSKHGSEQPSSLVWGGEARARVQGVPTEPEGFVGEGAVGGWSAALSHYERIVIDRTAGDLLRELGYADGDWIGATKQRRGFVHAHLLLQRIAEAVTYRLRRVPA